MPNTEAPNAAAALFNVLRRVLPGIPDRTTKLVLKMEAGKPPVIECTGIPDVIEGAPVSLTDLETLSEFELVAKAGAGNREAKSWEELRAEIADLRRSMHFQAALKAGIHNPAKDLKITVDASDMVAALPKLSEDLEAMMVRAFENASEPIKRQLAAMSSEHASTVTDLPAQGEALQWQPDPRLDRIVELLERIDQHLTQQGFGGGLSNAVKFSTVQPGGQG
ncbi:hypothetical protein ACMHYJ_05380 [Castellaniella hirudinis]|uniref:hypothetical protein n=1 Tax=Castellaniella hirudinis TaxID=1144617 RepID=UPI0039C3DAF5